MEVTRKSRIFAEEKAALGKLKASFLCARLHFLCPTNSLKKEIMGHQEDIVKTESKIIVIRDTQVILDRDVAELYGVTTKVVNQAIRNNPDKFPSGYVIELTNSEKEHVVKNFDHLNSHRHCHH